MKLSAIQWIYIIDVCSIVLISVPLAIQSIRVLHHDWKELYMIKRRPHLILVILVTFCYFQFISIPIVICIYTFLPATAVVDSIGWICYTILYLLVFASLIVMLLRFWLYYYDSQLIQFNKNKAWRMAIDPKKEFTNWFVDHKHNLGNWYFLLKITIIASIVETAILLFLWYFPEHDKYKNRYAYDKRNSKHYNEAQNNLSFMQNSRQFLWLGDTWFALCIFLWIAPSFNLIHRLRKFRKDDILAIRIELKYIIFAYPGLVMFFFLIVNVTPSVTNLSLEELACLRLTCTMVCLHLMFYLPVLFTKKLYLNMIEINAKEKENRLKTTAIKLVRIVTPEKYNQHENDKKNRKQNKYGVVAYGNNRASLASHSMTPSVIGSDNIIGGTIGTVPSLSTVSEISIISSNSSNSKINANVHVNNVKRSNTREYGWIDIVPSYDGFEAFMNHLASEFSMENLLFIQEYVQIKNVLQDFMYPIMMQVKSELRTMPSCQIKLPTTFGGGISKKTNSLLGYASAPAAGFTALLGVASRSKTDDSMNRDGDHDDGSSGAIHDFETSEVAMKTLPESIIAQQLRGGLKNFIKMDNNINYSDADHDHANDNDNDDDDDKLVGNKTNETDIHSKTADVVSKTIVLKIVTAFERLYDKYIDSQNAVFMINISSRHRDMLAYNFDRKRYNPPVITATTPLQNINSQTSTGGSDDRDPKRSRGISFRKRSIGRKSARNEQSTYLRDELKEYLKSYQTKGLHLTQRDLIKWITKKILKSTEPSVREIATLMNDSFSRFKISQRDTYMDICQMIHDQQEKKQESPNVGGQFH